MVLSVRDVGSAALQGLLTGVWIASGELSPGKRRVARAGAVVGLSAVGSIRDWAFPDDEKERDEAVNEVSTRQLVLTGVVAVGAIGVMVGRKRVENRWLAKLERDGHDFPHRALGVRMGALSFAGSLAAKLARSRF